MEKRALQARLSLHGRTSDRGICIHRVCLSGRYTNQAGVIVGRRRHSGAYDRYDVSLPWLICVVLSMCSTAGLADTSRRSVNSSPTEWSSVFVMAVHGFITERGSGGYVLLMGAQGFIDDLRQWRVTNGSDANCRDLSMHPAE